MIKSLAGSEESAEEMIELFLDRQGVDTRITDEIAIAAARKMGYFMWSEWDVPRQMEAKLATESLYISSIVLLPSPFPLSITVLVFFV
jgi:hypothetical protein